MDTTNLDDYLAGLGISDADEETALPSLPRQTGGAEAATSAAPSPDLSPQATPGTDPQAVLEQFLRGVARRFSPGLSVRVTRDGDFLQGEISGDDVGRLIGREGHVIEALDTLAYAAVAKHLPDGDHLRVRVDVGGYRARHFGQLRTLAERVAQTVASSGEAHTFQPMNPADRRVIHMTLKDNPHVVTRSVGEGTGRRLVVEPAPAQP